jgi:5'-nucleotidase
VLEVLPFGNQIATFGLKGSDVRAALEHGLSGYEEQSGSFPQIGGMRYTFDPNQPVGSRITSVEVRNADGGYSSLDPGAVYKMTSNEYLRAGGDGYDIFVTNAIDPYDGGALLSDALAEYIGAHSPVSQVTEGRIAIAEAGLPVSGGESLEGHLAGFVVLLGMTLIVVGLYLRQGHSARSRL